MVDLVLQFSDFMVSRGYLSPSTAEGYAADIRHFEKWYGRHQRQARWSALTSEEVEEFIAAEVADGKEFSSINRSLSALSSFYGYFVSHKMLSINPVAKVRRLRPTYHQREALDMDVIRQVLSQDGLADSTRALIALISESGLRIGEVMALTPDDVNLEYCQVRVVGKGRVERMCFFGPTAQKYLREYMHGRHFTGRLFPESRRQYNWDVWHACKPFVGESKCSPHILRHSFATACLENGMPLDVLRLTLGHKSIDTTLLYAHCGGSRVRNYNNSFGARI